MTATDPREKVGSPEWFETLTFEERLMVARAWLKTRPLCREPITSSEEGTLFHLTWAVEELRRLHAQTAPPTKAEAA